MVTSGEIINIVESCREKAPCDLEIRCNEPMAAHCTFKTGGLADFWVKPSGEGFPAFAAALLATARAEGIPVFFLGGGANILVADKGIRGIVLDSGGWAGEVPPTE
ncbi:MAG: UDP-N-acetylenolpyruvoylglucosamine reductase, partial [Treponema sp.]|nr:UDP-N-acetylenolpyruvoylglucosamine reductase [Treponema sp.]